MLNLKQLLSTVIWIPTFSTAWIPIQHPNNSQRAQQRRSLFATPFATTKGNLHGENSCFLPLLQLDQDSFAPRIIQIAGAYPGVTSEEYFAVQSEPAAPQGQWTYDFSDPNGPQLGTVAIQGSQLLMDCVDPVVIIAEHPSMGVQLPSAIKEPVDLLVLVDRSKTGYADRNFLLLQILGQDELAIAAFNTKADLPVGCEILGQVVLVQTPWLPSMTPTRTGFMESDEYF
jgi:Rubisco Assembly chaperone C-terminal domain